MPQARRFAGIPPRWRRLLPPLALISVAAMILAPRLRSAEQHVDEGWWIVAGKVSSDVLFRHHRPDHAIWMHDMASWGSPNPQLGKYLIGLSVNHFAELPPVPLAAADGRELEAGEVVAAAAARMGYRPDYRFERSLEENRADGRVPPPRILSASRRGVFVVSLLAALLLWRLARDVAGELAAAVALALWLANPALGEHSTRAMTDLPALAGTLLGLLGAVRLAALGGVGRPAFAALLVSAGGFGLGVAVKLSVLAPLAGALLVALAWIAHQALSEPPHRALSAPSIVPLWALAFVLVPLATTFATNPMLWTRPWTPVGGEPDRPSILLSLADRVETYTIDERLESFSSRLAATGRFLATGRGATLGHRAGVPFDAVLAALGVAAGALRLVRGAVPPPWARAAATFAAVSLVTWTIHVAWVPFDWERFYLPLLPAFTIAAASGVALLLRPAALRLRSRVAP